MIYADNAATTRLSDAALSVMLPFLKEDYANPSQPYGFAKTAKVALKNAREVIAECIGADADEIYFTSGGTEGDNWAIKSGRCGGSVITSPIEHHAVLRPCEELFASGVDIKYMSVDYEGNVLPDSLFPFIHSGVGLVSVMLANNEIGTVEPVDEIARIAHDAGIRVHTDAVQAVGHIPVDVADLGVDILSASAHKFNGPKGIGFMYIKNGQHIPAFITGGAQQTGMRAGTENVAYIVGMAAALKENCDNITENAEHLFLLEENLIGRLSAANIAFVRNGSENHIPGNISISFPDGNAEALLHRLDLKGICVSAGAACDSENTRVSHVLKAIGLDPQYAKGTIRISLGRDNTLEETDFIASGLIKILNKIR